MPWILFEEVGVEVAAEDAGKQLMGYGIPNSLRFVIASALPQEIKERIAETGALLTASIKGAGDTSASGGLIIEYMFSMDSILGSPGYGFSIDDLLLFDVENESVEVSFALDLLTPFTHGVSSHSYISLPASTAAFPMLPQLPRLSHPSNSTYLVVLQPKQKSKSQYDMTLNLTFDGALPINRFRVRSLLLTASTGATIHSSSLDLEDSASSGNSLGQSTLHFHFSNIDKPLRNQHDTYEMTLVFEYKVEDEVDLRNPGLPEWRQIKYKVPEAQVHAISPLVVEDIDYLPKSSNMKLYEQNADDESTLVVDVVISMSGHLQTSLGGVHPTRGLQLLLKSDQGVQ